MPLTETKSWLLVFVSGRFIGAVHSAQHSAIKRTLHRTAMEVNKRCLWLFAFQLFWFLCLVESYPEGVNFYKGSCMQSIAFPFCCLNKTYQTVYSLPHPPDWLRNKNEDDVERMIAEDQFEAPKLCKPVVLGYLLWLTVHNESPLSLLQDAKLVHRSRDGRTVGETDGQQVQK